MNEVQVPVVVCVVPRLVDLVLRFSKEHEVERVLWRLRESKIPPEDDFGIGWGGFGKVGSGRVERVDHSLQKGMERVYGLCEGEVHRWLVPQRTRGSRWMSCRVVLMKFELGWGQSARRTPRKGIEEVIVGDWYQSVGSLAEMAWVYPQVERVTAHCEVEIHSGSDVAVRLGKRVASGVLVAGQLQTLLLVPPALLNF
jgi:hypothetical protein